MTAVPQSVEVNSCPLSMQAWAVRKPVIAACNGHAVGAGLGLAVQADMRVFADEGKYGFLQSPQGRRDRLRHGVRVAETCRV